MNPRRKAFVREYTAGKAGVRGIATESAKAAGYSAKTAHAQGCRLLKDAEIAAAIAAIHEKAEAAATAKLREWIEMAPEAQDQMESLMRSGKKADTVKFHATKHILDRAIGPVPREVKHSGSLAIEALLDETDNADSGF